VKSSLKTWPTGHVVHKSTEFEQVRQFELQGAHSSDYPIGIGTKTVLFASHSFTHVFCHLSSLSSLLHLVQFLIDPAHSKQLGSQSKHSFPNKRVREAGHSSMH